MLIVIVQNIKSVNITCTEKIYYIVLIYFVHSIYKYNINILYIKWVKNIILVICKVKFFPVYVVCWWNYFCKSKWFVENF